MAHKHYQFPSLNGLAAFEAAGRHLSLTRAANEMNVTPGAVSKHLKQLETEIGAKLFVRLHRTLELTTEGAALLEVLRSSFTQISGTLDSLRKGGAKRPVTVGTTNAFAQFWLMPRMARFWNEHQDIVVDHVISDRTQENPISPMDLRVRYGSGQFRDEFSQKLFDDHIMAIAAPAFAAERGIAALGDVSGHQLLSVEGVDWSWTTWADFLRHAEINARRLNIRRFNSYVIAVQAALDGQGVTLGWKRLVGPLIAAGRLVAIGDFQMPAPQSFYLTWPMKKPLTTEAELLRNWLLNNID